MQSNRGHTVSIGEVIHKEKNQKKYNKATGQDVNLKKYGNVDDLASDKLTTSDLRRIKREAKYMKHLDIDNCYEQLRGRGLIADDHYRGWWCGAIGKLGVSYVLAQADLSFKNGKVPAALFHFLINKRMNGVVDRYSPRV